MAFDSFEAFLAMGKHGLYVWTSYAVFLVVIGANVVAPLWQKRRIMVHQRRLLRREEARQRRDEPRSGENGGAS